MAELLLIGGSGGSGTRAVVKFLQQLGAFAGRELNESLDSMPVARLLDVWVDRWLGRDPARTEQLVAEFAQEWETALQQHQGDDRSALCVVKNPRSMLLLDLLFRIRPDIRYLHLVRHGAAMVFSSNQRQFDLHNHHWKCLGANREQAALMFWAATNLAASETGEAFPGQYAWMQYEAFCDQPLQQIRRALVSLGIELDWRRADPSLIRPSGREQQQGEAIRQLDLEPVRNALERYGYQC